MSSPMPRLFTGTIRVSTGVALLVCLATASCDRQEPASAPPARDINAALPAPPAPAQRHERPESPTDPTRAAVAAIPDAAPAPFVYLPPADADVPELVMEGLHQEQDDALRDQRPRSIWRQWDDVMQRANPREVGLTVAALGDSLRAHPDGALYREIAAQINDTALADDERLALVQVLQFTATPEAMEILTSYLDTRSSVDDAGTARGADLSEAVREAIIIGARMPVDNARNWRVSAPLERAWSRQLAGGNEVDAAVIADSLAVIGTDSGTRVLVSAAVDAANSNEVARKAAQQAMTRLTSTDAVAALSEALSKPGLDPAAQSAIVDGLISIGKADAGWVLLDFLQRAEQLDSEQMARYDDLVRSRGFPAETLKVFAEALERGSVTGEFGTYLLHTALSTPPRADALE